MSVRVISLRLAKKEAHAIASAAIHGALHGGAANRFNQESADRIHDALIELLDYHDNLSAYQNDVEKFYA